MEEADLEKLREAYCRLADQARSGESHGRSDDGVPDMNELTSKKRRHK
jgi:hypothetical protein